MENASEELESTQIPCKIHSNNKILAQKIYPIKLPLKRYLFLFKKTPLHILNMNYLYTYKKILLDFTASVLPAQLDSIFFNLAQQ